MKLVKILMVSAKMATPSLLKIKVFWKKGYDVIISIHDLFSKILSGDSTYSVYVWWCDQSLVTAAFFWEKLS